MSEKWYAAVMIALAVGYFSFMSILAHNSSQEKIACYEAAKVNTKLECSRP